MFENIRNSIDFFIRNKTKFSRKNYTEKNPKNIERNRLINLYTLDILEKHFKKTSKDNIKILDIGSKNWFYAKGEHDFFSTFCNNFELTGIELDAYRLYSNFYSRFEAAKFYTKELKNAKYVAGDFLDLQENFDYITWFLPFITKKPLQIWGLPMKYFCPEKMLLHAYSLLNNEGQILIINQGESEQKIQEELLKKCNMPYISLGEINSNYFKYKNKRYGFLINKQQ